MRTKNHAAITDPGKVGELLRAIDGYQGQPATAFALKINVLPEVAARCEAVVVQRRAQQTAARDRVKKRGA